VEPPSHIAGEDHEIRCHYEPEQLRSLIAAHRAGAPAQESFQLGSKSVRNPITRRS
jgi:hypothetical protein